MSVCVCLDLGWGKGLGVRSHIMPVKVLINRRSRMFVRADIVPFLKINAGISDLNWTGTCVLNEVINVAPPLCLIGLLTRRPGPRSDSRINQA